MSDNIRGDLKISGSGSAGGGSFKDVSISGSGRITGDIDCENFKVSGSAHCDGGIKTRSVRVSGMAHVAGEIDCTDELKVSGTVNIGGYLKCRELSVSGETHIDGEISAERVRISGSMTSKNDCNAEEFEARGVFNISGMLNAGIIEAHLISWKSTAREIGGEKITVTRSASHAIGSFIKSIFTSHTDFLLETDSIEGDEIYLEGTKANIVRGVNVKIGPDCEIGLVEYKNSFIGDSGSVVRENRKI